MKAETKREIFAIPNLMGYFRILLIPIFAVIYLNATHISSYYIAAGIIALYGVTDFFDGKVVRKFNMITEIGRAQV